MGLTQRINALSKSNTFLAGDFVIKDKKETPENEERVEVVNKEAIA